MEKVTKVLAIIQARTGSTRLPGKVLLDLQGKPVLEHVVNRVRAARLVDDVVVATTLRKEDLALVKFAAERGVSVFCGSENDVLDRYYQAAKILRPDHVVRITADCPLMDPRVMDAVVETHLSKGADYTANTLTDTYPDGEDVEVFTFAALQKAWEDANLASEREHLTAYLRQRKGGIRTVGLEYPEDLSKKRWTLDNTEDFEFLSAIYRELYPADPLFGMESVLAFLKRNPDLEKINNHIAHNEGYLKSLKNDRIVGPR